MSGTGLPAVAVLSADGWFVRHGMGDCGSVFAATSGGARVVQV
ncbi:MAG: hypothetical protein ACLP50_16810 [Solirubrobacteraceae bacterium]